MDDGVIHREREHWRKKSRNNSLWTMTLISLGIRDWNCTENNEKHIFIGWIYKLNNHQSVQSLSCVRLFVTRWPAARQASVSISNSWSLPKFMFIESMMPSNHPILCHPLLLPPSIFPRIRVFSNESVFCIIWPKYWSFSFSISPSNQHSGLISFRVD